MITKLAGNSMRLADTLISREYADVSSRNELIEFLSEYSISVPYVSFSKFDEEMALLRKYVEKNITEYFNSYVLIRQTRHNGTVSFITNKDTLEESLKQIILKVYENLPKLYTQSLVNAFFSSDDKLLEFIYDECRTMLLTKINDYNLTVKKITNASSIMNLND